MGLPISIFDLLASVGPSSRAGSTILKNVMRAMRQPTSIKTTTADGAFHFCPTFQISHGPAGPLAVATGTALLYVQVFKSRAKSSFPFCKISSNCGEGSLRAGTKPIQCGKSETQASQ